MEIRKTTVREWYEELPEPYKTEATTLTTPRLMEAKASSLGLALTAMDLSNPENYKKWNKIKEILRV